MNNSDFDQRLAAVDLSRIMPRVQKELGLTDADTARAESHYRGFLKLRHLNPGQPIVPTRVIDEVWHMHVLFTRQYAADCEMLFGGFMHHDPSDASEELDDAFAKTTTLFTEMGIDLAGQARSEMECSGNVPVDGFGTRGENGCGSEPFVEAANCSGGPALFGAKGECKSVPMPDGLPGGPKPSAFDRLAANCSSGPALFDAKGDCRAAPMPDGLPGGPRPSAFEMRADCGGPFVEREGNQTVFTSRGGCS